MSRNLTLQLSPGITVDVPNRLVLLGCFAVLSSSGCSLLLDGDALTRGDDGARSGGTAGQSSAGTAGQSTAGTGAQSTAGTGAQSTAGTAGQSAGGCVTIDTCDGLDSDCKPTLDEVNCPTGCDGIVLNGSSYMACSDGATFNEAEVLCQAQNMHLVRIDDAAENNVTVELAQSLGSYIWLGASSLAKVGSYAWLDGTVFFRGGAAVDGLYQNFGPGQPVEGAGRNCVQLHNSVEGPWSNAPCSDLKPYVCERF